MKGNLKKITIVSIVLLLIAGFLLINKENIEKFFYPTKYESFVEKYSKRYKVDKYLIYSIIKTESKFKPDAVSAKGAKGLMQISDITAGWAEKSLGITDMNIYDPETNIMIGTWYLSRLEKEFGDLNLVISAYNGGSGNVRKWLNSNKYSSDGKKLETIPFRETSMYTKKVLKNYKMYRKLYLNH